MRERRTFSPSGSDGADPLFQYLSQMAVERVRVEAEEGVSHTPPVPSPPVQRRSTTSCTPGRLGIGSVNPTLPPLKPSIFGHLASEVRGTTASTGYLRARHPRLRRAKGARPQKRFGHSLKACLSPLADGWGEQVEKRSSQAGRRGGATLRGGARRRREQLCWLHAPWHSDVQSFQSEVTKLNNPNLRPLSVKQSPMVVRAARRDCLQQRAEDVDDLVRKRKHSRGDQGSVCPML